MTSLSEDCPYHAADVQRCNENGCSVNISHCSTDTLLKGEIVRDLFWHSKGIRNLTLKKAADYILFKSEDPDFVFLIELSKTLHTVSDIVCKFTGSLENLKEILTCKDENFNNVRLVFVVAFEHIRNNSEFKVMFNNCHININGQKPKFVKLKCGDSVDRKLLSENIVNFDHLKHEFCCLHS